LCERGHADRLVLSHDAFCHADWLFPDGWRESSMVRRSWTHVPSQVLPALRHRGVTEAQITQMMVDNPRAILERRPSDAVRAGAPAAS